MCNVLLKVLGSVRGRAPQGGARVLFEEKIETEGENGVACYYKFYMQFDVSPRAC